MKENKQDKHIPVTDYIKSLIKQREEGDIENFEIVIHTDKEIDFNGEGTPTGFGVQEVNIKNTNGSKKTITPKKRKWYKPKKK